MLITVKQRLIYILLIVSLPNKLYCQVGVKNPFEMVKVDNFFKMELDQFLNEKEKLDTLDLPVYIYNLLNSNDNRDYNLKNGIYSFRLMGPHFIPYLFFYLDGRYYIIKDYTIEKLLKEWADFFSKSGLGYEEKVKYLEKLPEFIRQRNE